MYRYNLLILLLLLPPLLISLWNALTVRRLRPDRRPRSAPRVSILVPARDEERSIEGCVVSLLSQRYSAVEVIVLDDGSGDSTPEILERLAGEHPELRLIRGEALPRGWLGKNHACHTLAAEARGEWLLFTDADTVHSPDSVAAAMAYAERSGVDLFSGVPYLEREGLVERAVVPMAPFLYFTLLPLTLIPATRAPSLSAANGQYLLCRRDAYERIGGHAAVRGEVVEDVVLARRAKRAGLRVGLVDAHRVVRCRMYRSPREVLEGFSKNLFPGLGYSIVGTLLFVAMMLCLYVLPPVWLAVALIRARTGPALWLPLLQLAIGGVIGLLLGRTFGTGWSQALLTPAGALGSVVIALRSAWIYRTGRGGVWKGRRVEGGRMKDEG